MSSSTEHGDPTPNESPERDTAATRERLNVLTQETRFVLVQNVLSHPEQLPTLAEFDYVNPTKSESTIREHLEILVDHEIVEVLTLPEEERSRDRPHKFYGLTDTGRELLERNGLLGAEETLGEMYEMLETTPRIERYADAPRPDRS